MAQTTLETLLEADAFFLEWLRFEDVAGGRAMRLRGSGEDYWRVDAD
jgi:hypothetical protein